jgi:hypothetical protein
VAGSDGDAQDLSTQELRAIQADREDAERTMADRAADPTEELAHERRAERAAYLRDKLEQQEDSERE